MQKKNFFLLSLSWFFLLLFFHSQDLRYSSDDTLFLHTKMLIICHSFFPAMTFPSLSLYLSTVQKKDVCGIKIYFYGELLMKRFVLLLNVWFTSARIYCWLKLSLTLEINWKTVHSKIPKIPFKLKKKKRDGNLRDLWTISTIYFAFLKITLKIFSI